MEPEQLGYFPTERRTAHVTAPLLRLVEWAETAHDAEVGEFFRSLTAVIAEALSASLVTVWDYTPDNETLVLQASTPQRHPHASYTIPARISMTGAVLEACDIVVHDLLNASDAVSARGERIFVNPILVDDLGIERMFSVPIFTPGTRHEIQLVMNICYRDRRSFPVSVDDLRHLADFVGICFEHRLYRRAVHIRDDVAKVAASAAGLRSLFESLEGSIKHRTHAAAAQMFRVERGALHPEGQTVLGERGLPKLSSDELHSIDAHCIRLRQTYMERVAAVDGAEQLHCRLLAVPVLSSQNVVLGVLCCKDPTAAEGRIRSFSSIDLRALQIFVQMLAPSFERFARLYRNHTLHLIERVAKALEDPSDFQHRLDAAMNAIAQALRCEVGSIYLRNEGTDTVVMRAAHGPNRHLIGRASYKIGEGLTGTTAGGNLINLRDSTEFAMHAPWSGKFDRDIWGRDGRERLRSLLALPIQAGEHVLGVLKLGNVRPTRRHPDTFFTDEDVQFARILASFLAHAIRSEDLEHARLLQFRLLAKTSLDMENASDESEAVATALAALEQLVDGAAAFLTKTDDGPMERALACGVFDLPGSLIDLPSAAPAGEGPPIRLHTGDLEAYAFPLRINDTVVGFLCVTEGRRDSVDSDVLVLRAFGSQLEATIARIRATRRARELADEVATRQRFVAAEAVSVVAVHRVRHSLRDLTGRLDRELKRSDVRQNRFVLTQMEMIRREVQGLASDLTSSLQIARGYDAGDVQHVFDTHPAIEMAAQRWNAEAGRRCRVYVELGAVEQRCRLNPEAIQEILNILFVNSEQAHARRINLLTINLNDVEIVTADERGASGPLSLERALCIEAADDGDGIAPDLLDKIFEPSFSSKTRRYGTGLGLFIARMLARRGEGELEACRSRSKGALFRLWLPTFEGM